jgi:hypothetical protein
MKKPPPRAPEADASLNLVDEGIGAWMHLPSQCLAASAAVAAWQLEWLSLFGSLGLSIYRPGGPFNILDRMKALALHSLADADYLSGNGPSAPFPE